MTLKSVVFPAPFGPRIARRSPCATSRSTSSTARSPPNRRPTPRKRRVGSACSTTGAASVTDLLDDLVRDDAVLDDADLPLPRKLPLHAGGDGAARRLLARAEVAAERLVDVRARNPHSVAAGVPPLLTIWSGYWSWIAWRRLSSRSMPPLATWKAGRASAAAPAAGLHRSRPPTCSAPGPSPRRRSSSCRRTRR